MFPSIWVGLFGILFSMSITMGTTVIRPIGMGVTTASSTITSPRVSTVILPASSAIGARPGTAVGIPIVVNQGGIIQSPMNSNQIRPNAPIVIPASSLNSQFMSQPASGYTYAPQFPAGSVYQQVSPNQQYMYSSSPQGTYFMQQQTGANPGTYQQVVSTSAIQSPYTYPSISQTLVQPNSHGHGQQSHASGGGEHGSHFTYEGMDGPTHWYEHFPECGGLRQSPINIDLYNMQNVKFNDLKWTNYWRPAESLTMENNGHTMEINGQWLPGLEPTISGGPLVGDYLFKQLHFHWGLEFSTGSEHTVNNQSFPMEMHAVHWKKQYGSYEAAIKNRDGLAVVAYLWVVGNEPNFMLESYIQYLPYIKGSNSREMKLPKPYPLENLDMAFSNQYVTYPGSLTTPPCSEIVTWIINSRPLVLNSEQLHRMRTTVQEGNHNIHNYRPIQHLNGRILQFAV